MRVRFTPSAREQFLAAVDQIRHESPAAAAALVGRTREALVRLGRFPLSGHQIPEFPELPHREVWVEPYRVFYRIVDDTVWVVGVWYGRQLPTEPEDARGP